MVFLYIYLYLSISRARARRARSLSLSLSLCPSLPLRSPHSLNISFSLSIPPPPQPPPLSLHTCRGSFPHAQLANEDTLRIEGMYALRICSWQHVCVCLCLCFFTRTCVCVLVRSNINADLRPKHTTQHTRPHILTYCSVKRDLLLQCQNRPIRVSKETYYTIHNKRVRTHSHPASCPAP